MIQGFKRSSILVRCQAHSLLFYGGSSATGFEALVPKDLASRRNFSAGCVEIMLNTLEEYSMSRQTNGILGILELDEGCPPSSQSFVPHEGSLFNPTTFDVPVITEMVPRAFADIVIRGDVSLEEASVAAAMRLVHRGATVITADCGFFIRHQTAISAAVNVPVITSSLLLIPTLLRQLAPAKMMAVISADSRYCTPDLFAVESPIDRARIIVGGIERGEYVRNALARPFLQTSLEQIEREVETCIEQLRANHPEIALLLFECTGLACVATASRYKSKLPVYDITNLCRLTLATH